MKTLTRFLIVIFASTGLALTSFAGPEPIRDYKDKVVAPVPPPCDWQGFYVGANIGGQWGKSATTDLDGYNTILNDRSRYEESGFVGGGQAGYNFQWKWLVLGVEGDLGFMDLDGKGIQPASARFFHSDTIASTSSDFYATFRDRIGVTFNHWLFYATGGGIAVNYDTTVLDTNTTPPGGATINAHKQEIDWGWTVGGGIEYMINCHWSIKGEYLYYQLDDQNFHARDNFGGDFAWRTDGHGDIVRAGLNFHF
jgi:outer membrane immunogenic protein